MTSYIFGATFHFHIHIPLLPLSIITLQIGAMEIEKKKQPVIDSDPLLS